MHRRYEERKRLLFSGLPSCVVEIGPGAGANFRYLQPGTRVIAVEPKRSLHGDLVRAAIRHGIELELRGGAAEELDLPDESVEAVIASLVLCSARDPAAVVRQVHRVLRPGGRFLCIEHVAARPGSLTALLQRLVRRPWAFIFDGCRPDRDTPRTIEEAGFGSVEIERFTWPSLAWPVRPQVAVTATK